MHYGRPPKGDLFHRAEEKGNPSWVLPSGEAGVIHTYQQTTQDIEGGGGVTQYLMFYIASVSKVRSNPEVYGILSIYNMYWVQSSTYPVPLLT